MEKNRSRKILVWGLVAVLLPIILGLLYGLYANLNRIYRFDQEYFTSTYRSEYDVPAKVNAALEQAIQQGDEVLYAELVGLRRRPPALEPKPRVYSSILLDVDDQGYFHYLYFNFETFHRSTYHFKEVNGRYIVAPPDLYYYWDSNQWWNFFAPPALLWWAFLIVVGIFYALYNSASRYRKRTFHE
jgi:hypothetical protein